MPVDGVSDSGRGQRPLQPADQEVCPTLLAIMRIAGLSGSLNLIGTVSVKHAVTMKSILVVDDNNDLRFTISASLSFAGYDVRQAANGRDAIVLVLAQKPDLILCDVKMPEMDGYRTLEAIRKFPGTSTIPFVLMMGTADWDESRQAMIRGADDCLMKPFSIAQLIEVIETRLASRTQVQREAYHQIQEPHGEAFMRFSPEPAPAVAGMTA